MQSLRRQATFGRLATLQIRRDADAEEGALRGKRLLAAGAAAAAVGLTVSLALAANGADATTGTTATAIERHAATPQVPRYYMALPGADNFANVPGAATAVLADTFTGKKLLTVRPFGRDKFVTVSAAADDRTFVLGAAPGLQPPAVPSATTWYLVRVLPRRGGAMAASVRKLRVPGPPPGGRADTTALSPDGRELAVLGTQPGPKQSYLEFLRVYSVSSGQLLRVWSGPLNVAWDAYTTLSWTAGNRQLAVGYTWFASGGQFLGVRLVDVARPGHDLVAGSRLAWSITTFLNVPKTYSMTCAVDIQVTVAADGTVVCGAGSVFRVVKQTFGGPACPATPAWNSAGFLEYSTVTGKQARAVYRTNSSCVPGGSGVLWVSASGHAVIGYIKYGEPPLTKTSVLRFGIFTGGTFTPLPAPPTTTTVPDAIAW
jgi:hypothetical protein